MATFRPSEKPLINDRKLRHLLDELERTGADPQPAKEEPPSLPPTSARRVQEFTPMPPDELERLRQLVKRNGLELINDGASYRCKRQRDFMIWTLSVSPLLPEERGGGESHALLEMVRRFCES
jgi:hypothetical protein